MTPTELPAWKELAQHANALSDQPLAELLNDTARIPSLSLKLAGAHYDLTKQRINAATHTALLSLASQQHLPEQIAAMMRGDTINTSEQRAVLHSALRDGAPQAPDALQLEVKQVRERLYRCAEEIRNGTWRGYTGKPITDIVHIGIGGSHLGPELAVTALQDFRNTHLNIHFVANIDAWELTQALKGLDPQTTLFIVVSKSFGTLETQVNANSARSWFLERTGDPSGLAKHFIGVTTNIAAATDFGFDPTNLFPLWDWVGGRFSLWSAVGFPILLSIGPERFQQFLDGAKAVDEHLLNSPSETNVPLIKALCATWNYNFLGAASLAVLSYDERLSLLPDYLQQLEMESNGKSVHQDGTAVQTHTMPILWGGTGTKGQHAYHQLLHQGTRAYAADFIVVADDPRAMPEHHHWLLANALAQSQAMAIGADAPAGEPHRGVAGNHASTTIVLDTLGPFELGGLLAVYEHKVFCQGILWDINSFDQWGVELGKQLAEPIYAELAGKGTGTKQDAATQALLAQLKK